MLYDDGYYKWSAGPDHDNPYYTRRADYSELNRTEGYKVLYFINFKDNQICINSYSDLKNNVDKLISQLKADLNISNKKRLIKSLNDGTNQSNSWYKKIIEDIQNKYTTFYNCAENKNLAASVSDVTGIFTALVSVVTSARDFRALQIKALCEQLDALRLKDFSELNSGSSSRSKKDETKEKE